MKKKKRCIWAERTILMRHYHDIEWGVPVHDDRKLFEFLILEGAQAGLSWETILNKRENYQKALDNFVPEKVSQYTKKDIKRLIANPGIIRNRLKIAAVINNARKFLEVEKEFRTFDKYIWRFVNYKPIKNSFKKLSALPAKTEESEAMSRDLKKRGFRFVGPTICYAFMQAVGMVNDHITDCFRYAEIARKVRDKSRT